jgi:hypothetical protein
VIGACPCTAPDGCPGCVKASVGFNLGLSKQAAVLILDGLLMAWAEDISSGGGRRDCGVSGAHAAAAADPGPSVIQPERAGFVSSRQLLSADVRASAQAVAGSSGSGGGGCGGPHNSFVAASARPWSRGSARSTQVPTSANRGAQPAPSAHVPAPAQSYSSPQQQPSGRPDLMQLSPEQSCTQPGLATATTTTTTSMMPAHARGTQADLNSHSGLSADQRARMAANRARALARRQEKLRERQRPQRPPPPPQQPLQPLPPN